MQEEIITEGNVFFSQLIQDISAAKKSVLLETYIFNADPVGERVTEALIKAAKRGVKIHLLIDGAGSPLWGGALSKKMLSSGIEVKIYHPFPWGIWQWSHSSIRRPLLLKAIYLILKMNARNHRKTCLIDEHIAYIGSFNIAQCHLPESAGGEGWQDTAIRLQNIDLKPLKTAFEFVWENRVVKEGVKEIFHHISQDPLFRLNHSWYRRRILYKNLLRRVSNCQERIWITNAYFIPDSFLLRRLKEAAKRNLDVRILLPQKSDVSMMPWASTTFYESLLKAGVRIFEYEPGMLHTKTLILDQWMIVGSSNLNYRSLLHDLEIDVNVQHPTSKMRIEEQFLNGLNHSKEICLKTWEKRPFHQRIMGRMLLSLKFWL